MKAINYYLEEKRQWLGYLQDYPDYWEGAKSFERLHSILSRLYFAFTLLKALNGGKAA